MIIILNIFSASHKAYEKQKTIQKKQTTLLTMPCTVAYPLELDDLNTDDWYTSDHFTDDYRTVSVDETLDVDTSEYGQIEITQEIDGVYKYYQFKTADSVRITALSPVSNTLAVGGYGAHVELFDLSTSTQIHQFNPPPYFFITVGHLQFSSDGTMLYVVYGKVGTRILTIWDIDSRHAVTTIKDVGYNFWVSVDGCLIANDRYGTIETRHVIKDEFERFVYDVSERTFP